MISPYVRRLRLADELKQLRAEHSVTHEQLVKRSGITRQQISRLENGRIPPDLDDVISILDALGVDGHRWTEMTTIAREAAERGWWDGIAKVIGERQAMFADLEAGAETIREYQQTLISGLLQTESFTRSRIERRGGTLALPPGATVQGVLSGRAKRQRMLHRPGGGPAYEVILDEFCILRQPVPPGVFREQLLHLVEESAARDSMTIRILPVAAVISEYDIPSSGFSIYDYPAGDPTVVGIEGVTTDVMLTEADQTARYEMIFNSLREATLSVAESRDYLIKAAETLPGME
ncbi:helix-turn-helix domain-containing protein [Actinomadura oligospora]|uniref:helix-turn-helix domain-containing protein n=1 Tax=Actinomadura oligospora TaxID=111804 RepID=UPI00047CFC65|nr:helix-turn-helix transcriptional regulator [Actinomadura oligospora]